MFRDIAIAATIHGENAVHGWASLRKTPVRDADLSRAQPGQADLRGAYRGGAQLEETSAIEVRFDLAALDRAQLPKRNARRARFGQMSCRCVDFSHARLDRADLGDASLEGSFMHRIILDLDCARLGSANPKHVARTDPDLARDESFRRSVRGDE
jgi:uncharacterized protein YjbI with pentapeptide repeats